MTKEAKASPLSSLDRSPDRVPPFGASVVRPVVLEGRFVRLEPLADVHLSGLVAAASGSRETYGFTWVPASEAAMRHYIAVGDADYRASRALPFATIDRATSAVIGSTRFGNIEYWSWPEGSPLQLGADRPDAVEIGWTWLAASAQRTPSNTEAKLLMLTHAFEEWRVYRVRLMTDSRNVRSRTAIERIGGKLDGILRAHQAAYDGVVRDSAVYSLLSQEWPEAKRSLVERLRQP